MSTSSFTRARLRAVPVPPHCPRPRLSACCVSAVVARAAGIAAQGDHARPVAVTASRNPQPIADLLADLT